MSNVLIIHPGALGDFILSIPAIQALKNRGFFVCVMVREPAFSLSQLFKCIDKALDLDLINLWGFNEGFEYIFLIGSSWDKGIINHFRKMGRVYTGPSVKGGKKWKVLEYLERFKVLGVNRLPEEIEIKKVLERRKIVSIHPGSGSKDKNWHIEGFLRVGEEISKLGFRVVFILGPNEKDMLDKINGFEILYEKPIIEVAELLLSSSFYIGNDSGVTHLSAILNTPTVAIFTSTPKNIWSPFGKHVYPISLNRFAPLDLDLLKTIFFALTSKQ